MAKTLAQGRKPGSGRKPGKGKTLREGRKPGSGWRRRQPTATGIPKGATVPTTSVDQGQQVSLRDLEAADALRELTNSPQQHYPSNSTSTNISSGSSNSSSSNVTSPTTETITNKNNPVSEIFSPQHELSMTNTIYNDQKNTNINSTNTTSQNSNTNNSSKLNVIEVVPPRPFLTYTRVLSGSPQDITEHQQVSSPFLHSKLSSPPNK